MAGVDEKEIQAQREQRVAAADMSAVAADKMAEALAYLISKGFSHDYSSELLRQAGADAILEQKEAAKALEA